MIRLYQNNRKLWIVSYPLHGGIYLILLWFILLLVGALTEIFGLPIQIISKSKIFLISYKNITPYPHPWSILIYILTIVIGYIAAFAILFGVLGLLTLRIIEPSLRNYAKVSDYINLILILITVISGLIAAIYDTHFIIARETMKILLLTPFTSLSIKNVLVNLGIKEYPITITIHTIILSIFIAYYPFTKMIHGPLKYITYHKIAWDNMARLPKVKLPIDIKINEYLNYTLTWDGPHVPKGFKWKDLRTIWPEVKKS